MTWPDPHEGFGSDAYEFWRIFNGLMPGGAWRFIRVAVHQKNAVESWPDVQREDTNGKILRGWKGNIAYPLGIQPGGWWLGVVDYDPRVDGADDSLVRLRELGMTLNTVTVLTGGEIQGAHYWLSSTTPIHKGTSREYPGCDFLAEGAYVLVPPSQTVHRYEFEHNWTLGNVEIAPMAPALHTFFDRNGHGVSLGTGDREQNRRTVDVAEKLYGFHSTEWKRDGTATLVRDGKDAHEGHSATVGVVGDGVLHVFSSNVFGLDMDGNYACFQLYGRAGLRDPRFEPLHETITRAIADDDQRARRLAGLFVERYADLRPEHVEWLYPPLVPLRVVTLMVGVDGVGKSSVLYEIAARASRGELHGNFDGLPVNVVIASAEDHAQSVTLPKLAVAGADLARVHRVGVRKQGIEIGISLPEDLPALSRQIDALGARLLVVDPLISHLPIDIDTHKAQHVRLALAPLAHLAEERGLAIVCVVHFNGAASSDVRQRISGSKAMRDASRSVILCGRDPRSEESDDLVLVQDKNSFGPKSRRGRLYRIEPASVTFHGDEYLTTQVVYGAEIDITSEQVVRGPERPREQPKRETAADFLYDRLMVRSDPRVGANSADLYDAAEAVGISKRTLQRAKADEQIEHYHRGVPGQRGGGETWWRYPANQVDSMDVDVWDDHEQGG